MHPSRNVAPPLFFPNDADTELYRENAITQLFMFDNSFFGHLNIILVSYALNGTFLGMVPASGKILQPCAPHEASHIFEFGRVYNFDCYMSIDRVFDKEATFYEAYLKFFDEKGTPQVCSISPFTQAWL
ncbi:unnamed protein product [Strongylus vulgaris]|uniref:Uncharacterized protein n=1 Tax=Strongylus vulgaris TaxID=40348 RepID=A0A3P7L1R6_STRVU|nr:unnamed protein product [Strongylus vulgaris]